MYKKINFKDIKHPETQQELQENIKRHFMCLLNDNDKLCLAVWGHFDKNAKAGTPYMLPLEDINSWDDIYDFAREQDKLNNICDDEILTLSNGTTFNTNRPTCPSIAPNIDFDMNEVTDCWFGKKSGDYLDAIKMYEPADFTDVIPELKSTPFEQLSWEKRVKILSKMYELADDENSPYEDFSPRLYQIENKILREFYAKTWGEFNYYSYYERKVA